MLNIFKSITKILSKKKNKESKPTFILATPPRNGEKSQSPKFQIGDSTKLKNELEDTKDKLEEVSNKNKILSKNSEKYVTEKSYAGKKRHQKTAIIKNQIIKPMFENKELIKSTSTKQRADKIEKELVRIFDKEDNEELKIFSQKYNLDFEVLQNSKDYFLDEKSETIYRWCLKFSK
jgi:preprotein translocase subunit SecD